MTKKDPSGTISVKTRSVLFWGTYPITTTTLTVEVLPIIGDRSGFTPTTYYSYSHALVTITNIVNS